MKVKEFDYPKVTKASLEKRQAEIEKVLNKPNHGLSDEEFVILRRELNNIDLKLAFQGQGNEVNPNRKASERYIGGMHPLNK